MSTTIGFPKTIIATPPSTTATPGIISSKSGFAILMIWALAMLSAGALAHFGVHSSELSAFELSVPY